MQIILYKLLNKLILSQIKTLHEYSTKKFADIIVLLWNIKLNYMRQPIKFLLTFFILGTLIQPAPATLKGGLEYSIPIDYAQLSQEELETKAGFFYNLALKTHSLNEETTAALNLYNVLSNKCPTSIVYPIRLGVLYDNIGKDRLAKGCFFKAIGIQKNNPEAYFYLGEFYYKRSLYRRALNYYKEAYKNGYTRHYATAYQIGDIYEKLGDTEAALKYLQLASELSPNSKLDNKLTRLKQANTLNQNYYSDTRIRLIER